MKTILTVDFDVIMNPSIQLYNDMANTPWEDRFNRHPLLKNLIIDFNTYSQVTDYLLNVFQMVNKENIHFIENHEQIIKYCSIAEKINLINIDHHHDYAYDKKDLEQPITDINCGNWGKKMVEQNRINSYLWISGDNSIIVPQEYQKEIPNFTYEMIHTTNLKALPKPDKVIICLSPPWIPPYLYPLYYTWMDIANTIHNAHFEVEK